MNRSDGYRRWHGQSFSIALGLGTAAVGVAIAQPLPAFAQAPKAGFWMEDTAPGYGLARSANDTGRHRRLCRR